MSNFRREKTEPERKGQEGADKANNRGGFKKKQKQERYAYQETARPRLPGVSVLHYGPKCKLYKFQTDMEEYARLHYGDLALMFIDDAYYVPAAIQVGDLDPDDEDDRVELFEEKKLRLKNIDEMLKNRPKLFAAIWMQLSDESREKIMEQLNYQADIRRGDNPLALWLAIKQTHMTVGATSPALNRFHATKTYQDMKMENYESLARFMERFRAATDTMRVSGAPVPDAASQAVSFIMKLDERFIRFQETLRNNDALGIGQFPATLIAAYTAASRYVVSNPRVLNGRGGQAGRRFVGASGEAAFVACEDAKPSNKPNNKKDVKCFNCNMFGHYARDCPEEAQGEKPKKSDKKPNGGANGNKKKPQGGGRKKNTVMYAIQSEDEDEDDDGGDDDEYAFMSMDAVVESNEVVLAVSSIEDDFMIHLDNQASRSLIRNHTMCTNVRHTGEYVSFTGVGGTVSTDLIGEMPFFGTVCILPSSPVNIIALHEVEDKFQVDYDPGLKFEVKTAEDISLVFRRSKKGMYVCNMLDYLQRVDEEDQTSDDEESDVDEEMYMATAEDNERMYSKDEVARAKLARQFMMEMGCTSAANLIKLSRGMVLNSPVSAEDIYRASKIYGPLLGAIKGKTKLKKAGKVVVEHVPRPVEVIQTLHSDLMHISKIPFLISVAMPMGLVIGSFLTSRGDHVLRDAFNGQLRQLSSRSFVVNRILVDGEGGIFAIRGYLGAAGIAVEAVGRNQHVPAVEVRNKILKQIFRGIYSSLPYKLPRFLFKYLVFFAISRINMYPVSSREDPTPARELFTGRKLDYKKDIRLGFGEYCQIEAFPFPRNDATKSRTKGAISLDPRGNLQGSVRFFVLGSEKKKVTVVTRDSWTKMVLTNEICDYITQAAVAFDSKDVESTKAVINGVHDEVVDEDGLPVVQAVNETQAAQAIEEAAAEVRMEDPPVILTGEEHVPLEYVPDVLPAFEEDDDPGVFRRNEESPTDDRRDLPPHEVFSTLSYKKGLKKHGDEAMHAAEKELRQMVDQDVWRPVKLCELTPEQRRSVIMCFMFLKEKFKPDGSFDKLKMRLVAGGHMQLKLDVDQTSSPTVALCVVITIFVYATKHGYVVVTVDITGAYLNAIMLNDVFMRISPELADRLVSIDPRYEKFRAKDGSIVVKLKKALYGCVESAKLWFDLLSGKLIAFGLSRSNVDGCVFSRGDGEQKDLIVAIYVDDLLICGKNRAMVDELIQYLKDEFKTITVNEGPKQAYLGMNFTMDKVKKQVSVTMEKYVDDIVVGIADLKGNAKTPATSDLFQVDEKSKELEQQSRKYFHSMVARLLYLAKRARPDILTTVSFLATRVKRPTEQDLEKLRRLLRYIRGTASLGLELSMEKDKLDVYVDASHCVHNHDGKSHTGVLVTVGSGPIFVRSAKQKLVAKSSTEAELIAISDSLPQLLWIRAFMVEQGMISKRTPVTIFEDNQSTIALIKKGRPAAESTRHIGIRHFFITDRCNMGEVKVQFLGTEEQVADFFTKPLVGKLFYKFRRAIAAAKSYFGVVADEDGGG